MTNHPAAPARATVSAALRLALIATLVVGCSPADDSAASDDVLASLRGQSRQLRRGLQLTVRDSTLGIGDTATVTVNGGALVQSDSRGMSLSVMFRSSDTTVVFVDQLGLLTARRPGTARITGRSVLSTGAIDVAVAIANTPATPSAPEAEAPATPSAPPMTDSPPSVIVPPPAVVDPPSGNGAGYTVPTLPTATVTVNAPAAGSRVIRVPAGNSVALQSALDAAVAGDEIVLADGATYSGNFSLRNRADAGTVIVRSETVPVAFGTRLTPARAGSLATVITTSVAAAVLTEPGAHGWRLIAVRFALAPQASDNYGIVTLGTGTEASMSQYAHDIVLDRVLVDGGESGNTSRCVSFNGIRLAVVDSWLANCHARGRDAQAVGGWTGPGPFLIQNNHLEGSGQAIMFGGGDPLVANVTPSDITIRRNHLFKPTSWSGGRWTVKAAFELKHAERVLFEGNVIENHWADAQTGFAILFQTVSQDSRAPWTRIRDITVRRSLILNSRSGINLLSRVGMANGGALTPAARLLFADNAFSLVGRDPINGGAGRFVQLLGDLQDATLFQNTFYGDGAANDVLFDGDPTVRLHLTNNVFATSSYGIIGSGMGEGSASIARYAPGGATSGNVLAGLIAERYPAGNAFPSSLSAADFVDASGGNLSLRADRSFSQLNGVRTGADGAAILAATAGVTQR
jgi:hypothetical protein